MTAVEENTNITYSIPTNESGYYIFSNLKDGTYRVEAELSGFKKTVRTGIEVKVNTTIRVDLNLEVGNLQESVTVVGESPVLQTDRADTGRLIEAVHLQEVPLSFNRNFQGMLITVPGATRPFRPHSDFFNAQDSLSTNVNGQSRLANNVQIEGIDDNHRTGLLTTLIPAADAIDQVSITTSAYDAEFGRAGGAITNVTLKSGTNQYKGSVFAFGNNEKTNAENFFTHSAPPTKYIQSGFTLGGPIQHDKLFFFGDYQHTTDHAGRTTRATIPPMAFRRGDFSAASTTIYDPSTGNPDGTGRTPFNGNIIPDAQISPIAKAILANLPAPNIDAPIGQNNYQIDYARVKTTDSFDTKVNWQMGQKDQISGRLSFLRPELTDPPAYGAFGDSKQGSPSGNGFAGTGVDTTYSTGVNYTRTWSNTLVMEVRGGLSYFHNEALSGGAGLSTATEVGIRGANIDEWTSGMTSIDVGNGMSSPMVGFSASLPWDRSERTVNSPRSFTKLMGNHTIKFGEDFRHTRDFLLQTQDNGGPRGQFQFRGGQTSIPTNAAATAGFANAFASFLLDVPSLVQRDLKVADPGVRFWAFFTFLQDKWQVSKNLTLDLGLRHEYYTPFIGLSDQGGLSNYDPSTNTLQVAGYGGVSKSVGVKSYWKNFGPRAGASYRLGEKTVLRGGYGVSTLPFPDNSYVYNFPVKQNNVFTAANGFAAGRIDAERVPRSGRGGHSVQRDHRREPDRAQERVVLPRAAGHARGIAALLQRRVPARAWGKVYAGCRLCRQSRARRSDAVQRERRNRPRAGQCGTAAFRTVQQDRGRHDLDSDEDVLQLTAGQARSPVRQRPAADDVLHARTGLELRQRRQQQRHRDARGYPAKLGAHRSGPAARVRRELRLSAAGRTGPPLADVRCIESDPGWMAGQRLLHHAERNADRHHHVQRRAARSGEHAAT